MFKAVIKSKLFKSVLDSLASTVEEARFAITDTGITIKCVDPANVLMTSVSLPDSAFEYYKATTGLIGLDIIRLQDIVGSSDESDNVTLEISEDNRLNLSSGNLKWTISLIDPTAIRAEPRIPEIDLPCMVKISGPEFLKIIKASLKVGDHIRLGVTDSTFVAHAGDNLSGVTAKIPSSELLGFRDGEASSLFSLDYLDDMSKASKKVSEVQLELGQDYPMRMLFNLNEAVSGSPVEMTYLMAPRIEQD